MAKAISIVIVNYNGCKWLEECLSSLDKLHYPKEKIEIILSDNASTDDSVEFTKKHFPQTKIVALNDNYGFCRANNLAAKEARGEYLVFLNNDTFVDPDWLTELTRPLTNSDVICAASKLLFPHLDDGKIINAAGGKISALGAGLYRGWMQQDGPEFNQEEFTGFGCAAAVLIQKQFFLDTGGFDEYYFYSTEEADLGLRVGMMGYKVAYAPKAKVYHYMGMTGFGGSGVPPAIEYLITRNQYYFMLKNFEFLNSLKGILIATLKTWVKAMYALSKAQFNVFNALLRAQGRAVLDLPYTLKQRAYMQSKRKKTDEELIKSNVLATMPETLAWHQQIAKNMRQNKSQDYYQNKDKFLIKRNEEGLQVFRQLDEKK